jgi:hypothetical protein
MGALCEEARSILVYNSGMLIGSEEARPPLERVPGSAKPAKGAGNERRPGVGSGPPPQRFNKG